MKNNKTIKLIISVLLTVGLSIGLSTGILYAYNSVSSGDTLTASSWNNLLQKVDGITTDLSGNVGIGTTNPEYKLDVIGKKRLVSSVSSGGSSILKRESDINTIWTQYLNASDSEVSYFGVNASSDIFNINGALYSDYSSKNIGIGTSSPSFELEVESASPIVSINATSSASPELRLTNTIRDWTQYVDSSGKFLLRDRTGTADRIIVDTSGNVGIGTDTPSTKLHVAGTITEDSDKRLKTNIIKLENSLEKISSINGYKYEWKDKEKYNRKVNFGVIAQDVEKVFPELVNTSIDGYKSIEYSHMIAPLIEAIKELKEENELLKSRVNLLEIK